MGRDGHLMEKDIAQEGTLAEFQPDAPPDAGGHDPRSPVPAVMVAGLARKNADLPVQQAAVCTLVVAHPIMDRVGFPLGQVHLYGRVQIDFQHIPRGFQQGIHRHPPTTEHIVCLQDTRSVQGDVGIGIQAVKAQLRTP